MKRIISIVIISGLCTAGCIGDSPYDPQAQCGTPTNLIFEKGNNKLSWSFISQGEGYFEIQYGSRVHFGKGNYSGHQQVFYNLPLYKDNKYDLYVRKIVEQLMGAAIGRTCYHVYWLALQLPV